MGNWNINIQGVGPHHNHNANDRDAERLARNFVRGLKDAGHTIESATFTSGSKEDIHRQTEPIEVPAPSKSN